MSNTSRLCKIKVRLVLIEGEVVGGSVIGEDLQDVLLLTGRELVLTVMVTVVRAVAVADSCR